MDTSTIPPDAEILTTKRMLSGGQAQPGVLAGPFLFPFVYQSRGRRGVPQRTLYLYGPDPNALFDAVELLLTRQPWLGKVIVVKRYGDPGAAEVRVSLKD